MKLQAAIFDVDGVVIDTVPFHIQAWTKIFNQFLRVHYQEKSYLPFTEKEYYQYVDGVNRLDGVKNFLHARNMSLPLSSKSKNIITVQSLADSKNQLLIKLLAQKEVPIFLSTIKFIVSLRQKGFKVAAVSASKNCKAILTKAKLDHLFDVILDGATFEKLHLPSRPLPDVFWKAAEYLNVVPQSCLIVEDSIMGIQAARAGNFGLSIAIDRSLQKCAEFRKTYADIIVSDLKEVNYQKITLMYHNLAINQVANIKKTFTRQKRYFIL